jgi:adenosylcobinamide-phosphate synthase
LNLLPAAGLLGVGSFAGTHPVLLVALACGLDRLVGDPPWCLHPVVVMGGVISRLRRWAEAWAGDRPRRLRLAGGLITLLLVGGSGLAGWGLERLALGLSLHGVSALLLLIALASALAGRSLAQAVRAVLAALAAADLPLARQRLSWIVGRDTDRLDGPGILRAAAETASENAVDGLFAPLVWMLVGAALWSAGALQAPGPLALAWGFKAASTLDSMLGYRRGRLRWLGTAGARLDDLLVWLPCRLVALGLPLIAGAPPAAAWRQFRAACRDGASDPSPNAGLSQAAYAHAVGVRLGGLNHYGGEQRAKPVLAADQPPADAAAVERMLRITNHLQVLWLAIALALAMLPLQ